MTPLRWWRNRCALKRQQNRKARAEQARREAFGPITPDTRAEDRQRLADAVGKKGSLI